MVRGRRTPQLAPEILPVIRNDPPAFGTSSGDLVFEKLDQCPACRTLHIKNGVEAPFLGVVAGAFSHGVDSPSGVFSKLSLGPISVLGTRMKSLKYLG
jgi:hypothetical protein